LQHEGQSLLFGLSATQKQIFFAAPEIPAAAFQPLVTAETEKPAADFIHTYCRIDVRRLLQQPCMSNHGIASLLKNWFAGAHTLEYEAHTGGKTVIKIN